MNLAEQRVQAVLNQPFSKFVGLEIVSSEKGRAHLRFQATENVINPAQKLHGGILNALLDMACYVALVAQLKEGQNAVTIDAHFNNIRATKEQAVIDIFSEVTARAPSVAFAKAEALVKNKLIASGSLTKSIVSL